MTNLVENVLELILRQRGALDIFDSAKLPCHPLAVFPLDRGHSLLKQLVFYVCVISQIHLGADDEARHSRAVVMYLGKPFFANVFE